MLKKILAAFPSFLITAAKLFALQFLLLTCCRILFYFAFKTGDSGALSTGLILKAFAMGVEFDTVASTYVVILPTLLLVLNELLYKRTWAFHRAALISTLLLFWLYALVSAADYPYYKQFGSHLNRQAFLWAASPGFVLRLIFGSISYYGYLFLFLLFAVIIFKVVTHIFAAHKLRLQQVPITPVRFSAGALAMALLLLGGARGRLSGKSTTHEGLALISDNLFLNQVALNPDFTLFRSLIFERAKEYQVPADIDESIAFARKYFGIPGPYQRSVSRPQRADSAFRPFNVVIVCMESMNNYKLAVRDGEALTPNFNALIKESVFFDNFFSSGIHTFNGLFSTCTGYPGTLTDHALRRYTKAPFITLGNLLLEKNYNTWLGVTHDPVFDNMEGFFTLNGYRQTLSSYNFPGSKVLGVTGVPDHELFDLFIRTVNAADKNKPFLGFLMTGSDHGPWDIPGDIPFTPTANTKEKRSTQYADWAIGEFMKNAKKQPWYSNTLFVFLGDHGYWIDNTYEMPLSYHQVPLVLHKPSTLHADTLHHVGYQPDVLSTVAGVLNLSFTNSTFGSDLMKEKHPFVYFTADDKIGCVDNDGYFFYNCINLHSRYLKKYRRHDKTEYYKINRPRADSLEQGARRMLDAAEYFLRKDHFVY